MDSILQQLYHGTLNPQETVWQAEAELNTLNRCQSSFAPLLHAQAPELDSAFDTMMDDLRLACRDSTNAMFYQGFSLAVKLITEALSIS